MKIGRVFASSACVWLAPAILLLTSCAAVVQHHPSPRLSGIKVNKPAVIDVADVGMSPEPTHLIGRGVSYWLPTVFFLADQQRQPMIVSQYVAKSLSEDLNLIGYQAHFCATPDAGGKPVSFKAALEQARADKADYLVATKVTAARTNYWGFLVIPLFQPVWTRIGYDVQVYDVKNNTPVKDFKTYHKETEWYFAKVALGDAIFDAALFGRHWHRKAWGETVVPEAFAQTTLQVKEILSGVPPTQSLAAK